MFAPERFARGLQSWSWLPIEDKTPILASLFGDVFLTADDGVWFLDTVEGHLTRRWDDRPAMEAALASAEGQDQFLLSTLAGAVADRGIVLGREEVYDFVPPPILSGRLDAADVMAMDFVVALGIAGQVHHQIRTTPDAAAS